VIRRLIARICSKKDSKKSKVNIEKETLGKDKVINEYNNEVCKKEQSKFDIEDFKKKHRHVEAARKACMTDSKTILFIAVLPEGPIARKIYFFTKGNPDQPITINVSGKTIREEIINGENGWNRLKEIGMTVEQTEVEGIGKLFHRHLVRQKLVLHNECDGMSGVWIYCKDEDINPLWEWIYLAEKKSFWGDIFQIVRIPENCEFEDLNFGVESVTILHAPACIYADGDYHKISKTGIEPDKKEFTCTKNLNDLNGFDYGIHVTEDVMNGEMKQAIENASGDNDTCPLGLNTNFLFLNIFTSRGPCDTCYYWSRWIKLISAKTCIYTSLSVPREIAEKFIESFYGYFAKGENVVEATKKAREDIDLYGSRRFWKFAYLVMGNPTNQVTWVQG
jgi:hypothetical protein